MNYRHSFHAGNAHDVIKHIVILEILLALTRKEKALLYLETHAGTGLYDLTSEQATRSGEHRTGILRLFSQPAPLGLAERYVDIISSLNQSTDATTQPSALNAEELRFYPGSPLLAKSALRNGDRLVLNELHPDDSLQLSELFKRTQGVTVLNQNGYLSLMSHLPPVEDRGLVVIDPPYELRDEWQQIVAALVAALKRWGHGSYLIWYPLKSRETVEQFYAEFKSQISRKTLRCEVPLYGEELPDRLNGSGLLIINPPYLLNETLMTKIAPIQQLLAQETPLSPLRLDWLIPER